MSNIALATFETSASTVFAEGSIDITKPSGLAVGDVLFVFLFFASTNTTPTPSGWTVVRNNSADFGK